MNAIETAAIMLVGLVLRLGVPALITVGLVRWLKRVDARWQAEAEAENAQLRLAALAAARPCWETRHCPPEKCAQCPAYIHPSAPCWQMFRDESGQLREACLGCEVFRLAPAPAV